MSSLAGRDRTPPGAGPSSASPDDPTPRPAGGIPGPWRVPAGLRELVDDRLLLARYLHERALSHPPVLAVLAPNGSGWSWVTGTAVTPEGWASALGALAGVVVLRPVRRGLSDPRLVCTRTEEGWRSSHGRVATSAALAAELMQRAPGRAWIAQSCSRPHPLLAGAAAAPHDPHVVVHTRADAHGALRVAEARLAVGPRAADLHRLDPLTGALTAGDRSPAPPPLAGLRVPLWDEITTLAIRAAEALLPLDRLRLDVAVGPDGAVLRDVAVPGVPAAGPVPPPRGRRGRP